MGESLGQWHSGKARLWAKQSGCSGSRSRQSQPGVGTRSQERLTDGMGLQGQVEQGKDEDHW